MGCARSMLLLERRGWRGFLADALEGPGFTGCEKPLQAVIPSPFAVILSGAKDLRISLRVNSARNLALSIFNAVRDSSSSRSDRDSSE